MWHLTNIPQVAHFYWSGTKLPYLRYFTILSFKSLNPEWKICLHTEKLPWPKIVATWKGIEQKTIFEEGTDYFDKAVELADEVIYHDFDKTKVNSSHAAIKSDWLRWRLLSDQGGLWSDLDIIYNHSMNNLEENIPENAHITSTINFNKFHSIGFLMSSPGDRYYKDLTFKSDNSNVTCGYQTIGSPMCKHVYNPESHNRPYVLNLNNKCVYTLISNEIEENLTKPMKEVSLRGYSWIFNEGTGEDLINNKNVLGFHWFGGRAQTITLYSAFEKNTFIKNSILGYLRNKFT